MSIITQRSDFTCKFGIRIFRGNVCSFQPPMHRKQFTRKRGQFSSLSRRFSASLYASTGPHWENGCRRKSCPTDAGRPCELAQRHQLRPRFDWATGKLSTMKCRAILSWTSNKLGRASTEHHTRSRLCHAEYIAWNSRHCSNARYSWVSDRERHDF